MFYLDFQKFLLKTIDDYINMAPSWRENEE